MRDRAERSVVKFYADRVKDIITENLESSRLNPQEIKDMIANLKELSKTSKDHRVRARCSESLIKLYTWQTEYEAPVAQTVEHKLQDVPGSLKIEIVNPEVKKVE